MTRSSESKPDECLRRGEIHLGDLARALATLQCHNDAQVRAIAACLGFGLAAPRTRPPVEVYNPSAQPRLPSAERQWEQPPRVPIPPMPAPPPTLPKDLLESRLQPLPDLAPAALDPDWLDGDPTLLDESDALPCAREPLFPERTSRHIISAALGTLRAGDAIDVPRLTAALARREPLRDLPRRLEPTLERGCQLLLDYSATMVPFWDDLTALIGQVGAVVGSAETQVFSFDARPTDALRWWPEGRSDAWSPAGRPVLAASDLGIQHRGGQAVPDPGWNALGKRCAAAGVPLLILIPWPKRHWPRALAGPPELIHWSPATSAGLIRRRLHPSSAAR